MIGPRTCLQHGSDDTVHTSQVLPANPVFHAEGKVARPLHLGNAHVDSVGQGQQDGHAPDEANDGHANLKMNGTQTRWNGMYLLGCMHLRGIPMGWRQANHLMDKRKITKHGQKLAQ